jgi:hydroxymethylglutaryl-CoA lyase
MYLLYQPILSNLPTMDIGTVAIRDCGPRDGLQSERFVPPEQRVHLIELLADAGLGEIEVAAFVSPKAVPAMAAAADVVQRLSPGGSWWALVPNARGATFAVDAGISRLTMTVSASPAYSEKNVGMTVCQSLEELDRVRRVAGVTSVDVIVSCAFGSPFHERLTQTDVIRVVDHLRREDVTRITLADTTGTASPARLEAIIESSGPDVGLHLHDTRGTALVNAYRALGLGVRRFDTAIGGLGGSPFAPGAGGNLATEDLVLLLDELGYATNVDQSRLQIASGLARDLVGHPLPSRVASAGMLPAFARS